MKAWGERERMWEQLEKKHQARERHAVQPRHKEHDIMQPLQKMPPSSFGGFASGDHDSSDMQNGINVSSNEKEKVFRVFERFQTHPALSRGFVPSAKEVLQWMQSEGVSGAALPLARRGWYDWTRVTVMAMNNGIEDFWCWWQSLAEGPTGGGRGYPAVEHHPQQDWGIRNYEQLPGMQDKLRIDLGRSQPVQSSARERESRPASARTFVNALKTRRRTNPDYVPYNVQRNGNDSNSYVPYAGRGAGPGRGMAKPPQAQPPPARRANYGLAQNAIVRPPSSGQFQRGGFVGSIGSHLGHFNTGYRL